MNGEQHQQLKQVLHIDLAAIIFGMVKSKKYAEADIQDMFSYITVKFVNVSKSNSFEVSANDTQIILESTFDFVKNLTGGVIDSNMRRNVTDKYNVLLKSNPELIERHITK